MDQIATVRSQKEIVMHIKLFFEVGWPLEKDTFLTVIEAVSYTFSNKPPKKY